MIKPTIKCKWSNVKEQGSAVLNTGDYPAGDPLVLDFLDDCLADLEEIYNDQQLAKRRKKQSKLLEKGSKV